MPIFYDVMIDTVNEMMKQKLEEKPSLIVVIVEKGKDDKVVI